jgi:cell division protein FtsI/penicillin-binding protein 2
MFKKQKVINDNRYRLVAIGFLALALWITGRLFVLQILEHDYYALFASSAHELYEQIHPERGNIYFSDLHTGKYFPAAINKKYYLIYAVPKAMNAGNIVSTTNRLAFELQFDDKQKQALLDKLSEKNAGYRVVAKKVPEEIGDRIRAENMEGIFLTEEEYRFYPEEVLGGPVIGFTTKNDAGDLDGKYGIEGYYNKKLSGRPGFTIGEKGAMGSWITLADRTQIKAENGPDIYLTIDRGLEAYACNRLREGMKEYEAKSAALVMTDPSTGAILAMCSLPDFDPNNYSQVDDIAAFNNTSVFTPYEPGSVFKTITMAAGLDLGLVSPNTTFTDPCELTINNHKVRNAEQKCYGKQTMTEVLEKSINTGAVWVEERVGADRFRDYVKNFGFGQKTGITLNSEAAGDISSLDKKGEIFGANGSFGQGLTATPLQVAAAFAAVANDGRLMRPFVVSELRYDDGHREKIQPEIAEQVITASAARLLTGMLVSVVENHYKAAKIPSYYVGGKTGTAQIAENGKYSDDRTNHTFAGFAPADKPKFTLVVKYEEPNRKWAEQTALPVFRDVMKYALDYYGVPGDRF